jgi:transposase
LVSASAGGIMPICHLAPPPLGVAWWRVYGADKARPGIGPISAAQVIVSFSHPGRCRNDAAFAALGGISPLEASSGRTVRHRLNRGGDRALNRALHTIALTRMASCPRTRAYVARRTAEGKTPREIRRCLKRYIARELYRTLTTIMINN